jgi:hypothetical protein
VYNIDARHQPSEKQGIRTTGPTDSYSYWNAAIHIEKDGITLNTIKGELKFRDEC